MSSHVRRLLSSLVAVAACLLATDAAAARLRGTVLDPQGRPVPGARVHVTAPDGGTRDTRTAGDGTFVVDALGTGAHLVRASADGLHAEALAVDLAAPDAEARTTIALQVRAVTDSVVVTASSLEAPLSTVPASTTVVTADDLRLAQAETLADVMRGVPGLTVATSGGRGAVTSLFPRGGESDYTLVLLDGLRLNAFGGGLDAAHFSPAGVERVEVVRGPQSALYGADAIGGVLQVVTRRGGPLSLGTVLEGGSQETARAAADASGGARGWSWHGSGQYQQSQGLNGERSAAGETVANDDYTARQATAGGGWRGPGREVRGFVHAASTARGNPGPFGADPNGTFAGIDRVARGTTEHVGAALAASQSLGARARLRANATLADLDSGYASAWGATFTETRRGTARMQADWTAATRLSLSGGAELLRERARNTYIVGSSDAPVPIAREVAGSFAEARYEDGGRLFVAAGLRAERIARDRLEGAPGGFPPRPDFARDTVTSWNPKLSASWMVRPMGPAGRASTRLKVNAGTGIRPPDAFEIAFTDNPGLKPERSRSVDVGVEQVLARGRAVVEATWFANRYDDLIVAVGPAFADTSRYRTDNVSNARARGLELAGALRLPAGLAVRAGYTHLRTEILAVDRGSAAPAPFTVGQPLLRRPRHQAFVHATYAGDRVDAFLRVTGRGEVLDVDPSFGAFGGTLSAPGYVTTDVGGAWRPFPRARHAVFVRVTNLLDRAYEDVLGFPAAGRSVIAGLRLAHGR